MVVDSIDLHIIWEEGVGYHLSHIYLDEASAELALLTYFTPEKVQGGRIRIEKIQAKRLDHCCEM